MNQGWPLYAAVAGDERVFAVAGWIQATTFAWLPVLVPLDTFGAAFVPEPKYGEITYSASYAGAAAMRAEAQS